MGNTVSAPGATGLVVPASPNGDLRHRKRLSFPGLFRNQKSTSSFDMEAGGPGHHIIGTRRMDDARSPGSDQPPLDQDQQDSVLMFVPVPFSQGKRKPQPVKASRPEARPGDDDDDQDDDLSPSEIDVDDNLGVTTGSVVVDSVVPQDTQADGVGRAEISDVQDQDDESREPGGQGDTNYSGISYTGASNFDDIDDDGDGDGDGSQIGEIASLRNETVFSAPTRVIARMESSPDSEELERMESGLNKMLPDTPFDHMAAPPRSVVVVATAAHDTTANTAAAARTAAGEPISNGYSSLNGVSVGNQSNGHSHAGQVAQPGAPTTHDVREGSVTFGRGSAMDDGAHGGGSHMKHGHEGHHHSSATNTSARVDHEAAASKAPLASTTQTQTASASAVLTTTPNAKATPLKAPYEASADAKPLPNPAVHALRPKKSSSRSSSSSSLESNSSSKMGGRKQMPPKSDKSSINSLQSNNSVNKQPAAAQADHNHDDGAVSTGRNQADATKGNRGASSNNNSNSSLEILPTTATQTGFQGSVGSDSSIRLKLAMKPMPSEEHGMRRATVKRAAAIAKFRMVKFNSCSTLFVDTTMVNADLRESLRYISLYLSNCIHRNIQENLLKTHEILSEKTRILSRHIQFYHRAPSAEEIYRFLECLFQSAELNVECVIITLIYIQRMLSNTGLTLQPINWARTVLGGVILASKVWDDHAVWNVDFCQIFPDVDVSDFNDLERFYMAAIHYDVSVRASLYAKYYFELRDLADTSSRPWALKPLTRSETKKLMPKPTNISNSKLSQEEVEQNANGNNGGGGSNNHDGNKEEADDVLSESQAEYNLKHKRPDRTIRRSHSDYQFMKADAPAFVL
ncbi:hypothetical protein BC831DRAFT_473764 [Entophlyctis helioformis]|nr:hypothetical protein BC831DRAFT_473764 [Entophlyctis helioformis]